MAGPLFIPDDFLERSAPEFAVTYGIISARFWHLDRLGEIHDETVDGLFVRGAYQAVRWLADQEPNPPGSRVARLRTRYDLLDVLRLTELCCSDEIGRWESEAGNLPTGIFFYTRAEARGAKLVYEWALRIRNARPFEPLSALDQEAALAHYRQALDHAERRHQPPQAA